MTAAEPLLAAQGAPAPRTWHKLAALLVLAGSGALTLFAVFFSNRSHHLSRSLHLTGVVTTVESFEIYTGSAAPVWLEPIRELGRALDGGYAVLRMFEFMPKTSAYLDEISPDACSAVRLLDEQQRSPALQKEMAEILRKITRRQNFTGIQLMAAKQDRVTMHEHLGRVLDGLQPWLDAHRDLHEDPDLGPRKRNFISQVQGLVPSLKESLLSFRNWIVGENDPPFFQELAHALHAQGWTCPTDVLQHAAIVSSVFFQAGFAYCESLRLQGQATCDMSWSWGLLAGIREAVRAQGMRDFGLPDQTLAECLGSEMNSNNVLVGADAGLPWLFLKHICTGHVHAKNAVMGELSRLRRVDPEEAMMKPFYFAVYHNDSVRVEARMKKFGVGALAMLAPQSCGQRALYVADTTFAWQSLEGNCGVTHTCITSPGYADGQYDNHEYCKFRILVSGTLSQEAFETYDSNDVLSVDGKTCSGDDGPGGLKVTGGGLVTWSTDGSYTSEGWKICLAPPGLPNSRADTNFKDIPEFCRSFLRDSALGQALSCTQMWLEAVTPNIAYPVVFALVGVDSAFSDHSAEGTLRQRAGDGLLVVPR